jgi:hypothetical protein
LKKPYCQKGALIAMLKKSLFSLLVSLALLLVAGCDTTQDKSALMPVGPIGNIDTTEVSTSVVYSGHESLEQMLNNYQMMVDSGSLTPLDPTEKEAMINVFLQAQSKTQAQTAAASQTVIAYTTHYVWHGLDRDLYLEYKWYAGSRQGYGFQTPIWALYYAIQTCYGGRLSNWTWMEGAYQRVTAVVGMCVWAPFGSEFTRQYLRIVAY